MSDSDSPVASGSTDEDVTIPRAAMNKMIKDVVPGQTFILYYF